MCQGLSTPHVASRIVPFRVYQQVGEPVLEFHVIMFSLTVPGTISTFVCVHQEANTKIVLGVQKIYCRKQLSREMRREPGG